MDVAAAMGLEDLEVFGMSPTGSSAMSAAVSEDEGDLRRGPWTVEEDVLLVNYIAVHGEGRWNSLARSAGLKRTGKSCRLRWLNYLRPDVRRGNITAEEQLLILELHSRWGNRWSKIAQHLPGRTDNEIKNYWRTRVQKHARHLRCDVNSAQFRDLVRRIWMPRLVERIQAHQSDPAAASDPAAVIAATTTTSAPRRCGTEPGQEYSSSSRSSASQCGTHYYSATGSAATPTNEGGAVHDCGGPPMDGYDVLSGSWSELLARAGRDDDEMTIGLPDFEFGDLGEDYLWSLEDLCLQQQCS